MTAARRDHFVKMPILAWELTATVEDGHGVTALTLDGLIHDEVDRNTAFLALF